MGKKWVDLDACYAYDGAETFNCSNYARSGNDPIYRFRRFYCDWTFERQVFCCSGNSEDCMALTVPANRHMHDMLVSSGFAENCCVEIGPKVRVDIMLACFMMMRKI